jgi:predicted DNA-binding protein
LHEKAPRAHYGRVAGRLEKERIFNLTSELDGRLSEFAVERGWSVAAAIRYFIEHGLNDGEAVQTTPANIVRLAPGDASVLGHASPESASAMRELAAGVAFWRKHTWPADFHNADYQEWARQDPHGDFTLSWWHDIQLPKLQEWIATRGVTHADLTARFSEHAATLSAAWEEACVPHVDEDISTVTWVEVQAFPTKVALIKPTKTSSPVFASKFCHFLLPRIFPVVDNEALGNRWRTYEDYFKCIQDEWQSTAAAARTDLITELTHLVEAEGEQLFAGFPIVNKIVELRLIGRRQHGTGRA